MTNLQLEFVLLITALCAQQCSCCSFHSTSPYPACTSSVCKDGMVLEALLSTRQAMLAAHPLPSKLVISSYVATGLVKHDLSFINSCWLLTITFLSFMYLEIVSWNCCFNTFPGIKGRLGSSPDSSFCLLGQQMEVIAFFQFSRIPWSVTLAFPIL